MAATVLHLPHLEDQEWREISFARDYEISEYGVVRRLSIGCNTYPGKVIKPSRDRNYPQLKLTIDSSVKGFKVHKLVALVFIGPQPFPKAQVAHLDGNGLNCHHTNLAWKTASQNQMDKHLHGTMPMGENHPRAKITEDVARKIKALRGVFSEGAVARMFGITRWNAWAIMSGRTWKHLPPQSPELTQE